MFKTLIKKVREESNNPSILPENNSDEINGHGTKENNNNNNNSLDEEHSLSTRTHRKLLNNIRYIMIYIILLKDVRIRLHNKF